MIQPEMIVAQVEQGEIPGNWRVLSGTGSPVGIAIFFGFFTFFFVCICAFALVAGSSLFGIFGLFQPGPASLDPTGSTDPLGAVLTVSPLLLLISALVAVGVGILTWSRRVLAKDSRLIFMPEGVIQCVGYSTPAKRRFKVLDYGEISRLDLRVRTTSSYNETTSTINTRTNMWLDLLKYNGTQERWVLNRLYGSPEATAQQIIAGHAQYKVLHP